MQIRDEIVDNLAPLCKSFMLLSQVINIGNNFQSQYDKGNITEVKVTLKEGDIPYIRFTPVVAVDSITVSIECNLS